MSQNASPAPLFVTDRLLVRPWTTDDAESVFAIFANPVVARFSGGQPVSVEAVRANLERWISHFKQLANGLGFWAIVERGSRVIVGEVKLVPLGGPLATGSEVELAYFLNQRYWGRGYATEAARGALHYGFETLKLPRIWVLVHPENHASLRVAARLELTYLGRKQFTHHELEVYCKERPADSDTDDSALSNNLR